MVRSDSENCSGAPTPMTPTQFDAADSAFVALVSVAFDKAFEDSPRSVRQSARSAMKKALREEFPAICRLAELNAAQETRLRIFLEHLENLIENHHGDALRDLMPGVLPWPFEPEP